MACPLGRVGEAMKCDTPETRQLDFQDDDFAGMWCAKCWLDYNRADGAIEVRRCVECSMVHLLKLMAEKLEGHYCESCAKEYEEKLLAKMSA